MTIIEKTVAVFVFACAIAMLVGFYFVGTFAMDRSEVVECNKWKAQSEEFAGNSPAAQFYLLKWQKEQCDAHGIFINAQVK